MESLVDKILIVLGCENDQELINQLQGLGKINQSQLSRWRKNGFAKSTEILLVRLLNEIEPDGIKTEFIKKGKYSKQLTANQENDLLEALKGSHNKSSLAKRFGIDRGTIYKIIKRYENDQKNKDKDKANNE